MKKLSLATFTLLGLFAFSSSSFAIEEQHNSCDTNINGEVNFADNLLQVTDKNNDLVVFNKDGEVSLNGKSLTLSNAQKQSAKAYYENIEQAIPMAVDVTLEALNIANIAISEVFVGLLSEETQLPKMLDKKFKEISTSITNYVYQNPESLTFNSQYFEKDLGFEQGVEKEIEAIQEEVMASFMGEVMVAMGKAMMSGDTNISDFETRIEQMSSDLEAKTNKLAEQIEQKAYSLCDKLEAIDKAETQLQTVKELRHLNIISVTKD